MMLVLKNWEDPASSAHSRLWENAIFGNLRDVQVEQSNRQRPEGSAGLDGVATPLSEATIRSCWDSWSHQSAKQGGGGWGMECLGPG